MLNPLGKLWKVGIGWEMKMRDMQDERHAVMCIESHRYDRKSLECCKLIKLIKLEM